MVSYHVQKFTAGSSANTLGLSQASTHSLSPATSLSMESVRAFCAEWLPLGFDPCFVGTRVGSSTPQWVESNGKLATPSDVTEQSWKYHRHAGTQRLYALCFGAWSNQPIPAGPLSIQGLGWPRIEDPEGSKMGGEGWNGGEGGGHCYLCLVNRLPVCHGKAHKKWKMAPETAILSQINSITNNRVSSVRSEPLWEPAESHVLCSGEITHVCMCTMCTWCAPCMQFTKDFDTQQHFSWFPGLRGPLLKGKTTERSWKKKET